jgi:hypothetical protein
MSYAEHEAFTAPQNKNQIIWRYMTFSRYVSTLNEKALFFSRVDLLGDPFEGSVSKATVATREESFRQMQKEQGWPDSVVKRLVNALPKAAQDARTLIFVNCWNMSDYESPALWTIYGKGDESVAIQSTFSHFVTSLEDARQSVHIGAVSYIDYETEYMPAANLFYPSLHKRRGFQHERELRAAIMDVPVDANNTVNFDAIGSIPGHYVPVNLDALIQRVYVAPTAPDWFLGVVKSVTGNYGLSEKEVIRSTLAARPSF